MGMLDFLKKKTNDDLGMGMDPATGLGMEHDGLNTEMQDPFHNAQEEFHSQSLGQQNFGPNTVNLSTMGTQNFQNMNQAMQGGSDKDIQIVSLKLDAIKAELDSINQRLRNIELIAEKEQQQQTQQKRWY